MKQSEWAKREIEIACKKENPEWDGESFDYGCSCYQSALKAYNSLAEDEHSGCSWNITKNILIRLMNSLPLTPITDEDFDNSSDLLPSKVLKELGFVSQKQCQRMSSLFRYETLDGKVTYSDVNRVYCIDINNEGNTFTCSRARKIVDQLYPITMPYKPTVQGYKIYTEDFLTVKKDGDYDTQAYIYMITPSNERIDLNIYEGEVDGKWISLTKEQYEARKQKKI